MADQISHAAQAIAEQDSTVFPKRSHKKSRLGCTNCKLRKVKCDEVRPVCRSCRYRRTKCDYDDVALRRKSSSKTPRTSASQSSNSDSATSISIVNEPHNVSPSNDTADMRLLWFYTSNTHKSLSYADNQQNQMNRMLQTVVVQLAFEAPFLMDSILELASLHMQSLGLHSDPIRTLAYRVRAFEGYRKAIQNARPETFGALLANSVLRPILLTQFFRDPNSEDLYIMKWMLLWRGIQSIVKVTSWSSVSDSGLRPLFARPSLEPESSIDAIPKDLLLMVSFITHDDEDASEMETYQESLRALGSLFDNLKKGMDSIMALRIMTWSTVIPLRLLELAQASRPRALIILAHYAVFLKLVREVWWLEGVGDRSIRDICNAVGPRWHKFLKIPISVLHNGDVTDLSSISSILDVDHRIESSR